MYFSALLQREEQVLDGVGGWASPCSCAVASGHSRRGSGCSTCCCVKVFSAVSFSVSRLFCFFDYFLFHLCMEKVISKNVAVCIFKKLTLNKGKNENLSRKGMRSR